MCDLPDAGTCYRTVESCSEWDELEKALEVCKKQQSCRACVDANRYCWWSARDGTCSANTGSFVGDFGNFIHDSDKCPAATTTATFNPTSVQTTTGSGACSKCGMNKKSRTLSCCARGGSWFRKCGAPGDRTFEHTWYDGIQACGT